MSLSELLQKGLIRKADPDKAKATELLAMAERDLKAASDNLKGGNNDWALAIAYNAMLSAGRSLMSQKGYYPVSDAHHLAVVQFCAAILPSESGNLAITFNRYRVRRHDVIYGESESVGKNEAEKALANARSFVDLIKKRMGP